MNTFKKQLQADIDVFFNLNELGEKKYIEGKRCTVVIDNELIHERPSIYMSREGVSLSRITFFVKESELGFVPEEGSRMRFGDVAGEDYPYTVISTAQTGLILEVTIEASR